MGGSDFLTSIFVPFVSRATTLRLAEASQRDHPFIPAESVHQPSLAYRGAD